MRWLHAQSCRVLELRVLGISLSRSPSGVAGVLGDTMDIMRKLGQGLEKGRCCPYCRTVLFVRRDLPLICRAIELHEVMILYIFYSLS